MPLVTDVIRNGAISSEALASQTPERPPLVKLFTLQSSVENKKASDLL